MMTDRFCQC